MSKTQNQPAPAPAVAPHTPGSRMIHPLLAVAIQTGDPVVTYSDPGQGKSEVSEAFAAQCGRFLAIITPSHQTPDEIAGLPDRRRTKSGRAYASTQLPPDWAIELKRMRVAGAPGMILAEELTTASRAHQPPLLSILHSKRVGRFQLPPDTWILAVANPPESAANGTPLAAPVANRCAHMPWTQDHTLSDWRAQLRSGFTIPLDFPQLPESWADYIPNARRLVADFLDRHPTLTHALPKAREQQSGAWASPRSWTRAATLFAALRSVGLEREYGTGAVASWTGAEAAGAFATWLASQDLVSPEDVLADPAGAEYPARPDQLETVIGAVVAAVRAQPTAERLRAALAYFDRCAERSQLDIVAVPLAQLLSAEMRSACNLSAKDMPARLRRALAEMAT